jgi:flagellar motor switch protein FliG
LAAAVDKSRVPATAGVPSSGPRATLSGPEKAALLLLSLDEARAAAILGHLEEDEIRRVHEAIAVLGRLPSDAVRGVVDEFSQALDGRQVHLRGGAAYLRRLASRALGEERAARVLDPTPRPAGPLADLGRLDAEALASVLSGEHPQTRAAILAHLPSERAAAILEKLEDGEQADAVRRMAALEAVPRDAITEAERALSASLGGASLEALAEVDGVSRAAALLNRIEAQAQSSLLDRVAADDPDAAGDIRRAMFTFDDLGGIEKRGMQVLLKEISTDQLVVALKSASDDIKEKVFGNISTRAAAMLKDELEMLGPERLSDVEAAQRAIVETAMGLERDRKITIAREGGGEYV